MRFKHIKQRDSMQCGVACLAMIAHHFGKSVSLAEMESHCQVGAEGTSLKGLAEGASRIGLQSVCASITVERLLECPLPCVLMWDSHHYVVLYGAKRGRFRIADPAVGCITLSVDDFMRHWLGDGADGSGKGIAAFFEPDATFAAEEHGQESTASTLMFLLRQAMAYRRYFAHIAVSLGAGCLLQLIVPLLTQGVVDLGIGHRDLNLVWMILLGELFVVMGRAAIDYLRRWVLLHISVRINVGMVSEFLVKLMRLPMPFFDSKNVGDLVQRLVDHTRVENFVTNQLLGAVFSVVSLIILSVMLVCYNVMIFAVFAGCTVAMAVWSRMFMSRRKALDYESFKMASVNNSVTYELFENMQEIKVHGCERRRRWEWEDVQAELFRVRMKSLGLDQMQGAGSVLLREVQNILIIVLSATLVIDGQLTLGGMLALQYVVGQLSVPVQELLSLIYSFQDVGISMSRINEVHRDGNDEDAPDAVSPDAGVPAIDIDHATFSYDIHATVPTLRNVSIHIPSGRVTAIVGHSGSGKTTLMKLLLGFYPVASGKITVGSEDVARLSHERWRARCGVVMQEGVIFSDTIERNIAPGDGELDTHRIRAAAAIACIDDYIEALPLKYKTKIGRNGVGMSKGQKQRILIARAVYRNPDFVMLDEATNSLDTVTERRIIENLNSFYNRRTVVVIAHRLSTVRHADNIIVLEKGVVVETGNHETLIRNKGCYYRLVNEQLNLDS